MPLTEAAPQKSVPAPEATKQPQSWRAFLPGLAAAAALCIVAAATCAVFWPGHVDPDTTDELNQAATGNFGGWHAPVLVAIWRVAYIVGLRSPGWVLAGSVLALATGTYLLLRARLSRPLAVAGAAACVWFPPILAWDVQVGVDAWFAALAVLGFGCVVRATRTTGRTQGFYLAAATVAAFLVACTRLTALPVTFLILTAVWVTAVRGRWLGRRYGLRSTVGGVASTVVVALLITGIDHVALHTYQPSPAQGTYIYDLAALSRAKAVVMLPANIYPAQQLGPLYQFSSTTTADLLEFDKPPLIPGFPLQGAQYASLQGAWMQAIERYPGTYLHERLKFTLHILAIDTPAFYPHELGPPLPGAVYAFVHPQLHQTVMDYVSEFTDNIQLETPWVYAVLLAVSAAWFGRRRSLVDRVFALFAVALLAYLAVMAFALPSAIYRYVYPLVCGGSILALLLIVELVTLIATQGRRRTTTAGTTQVGEHSRRQRIFSP